MTVAAGSGTITYGGSFTPSFIPTGLVGTDSISSVTYTYTGTGGTTYGPSPTQPSGAGTYSVTPSAAVFSHGVAGDYTITYTAGSLTISKASMSLTFGTAPSGVTYGEAAGTHSVSATPSPNVGSVVYAQYDSDSLLGELFYGRSHHLGGRHVHDQRQRLRGLQSHRRHPSDPKCRR